MESALLPQTLADDMISQEANSEYGLGPCILEIDGLTAVQHGGSNNSCRTFCRIFPETQSGWVVFTNVTDGNELIGDASETLNRFVID